MIAYNSFSNNFGWRWDIDNSDPYKKNLTPKQHGHSQHVAGKSKKSLKQEKLSRRINRKYTNRRNK